MHLTESQYIQELELLGKVTHWEWILANNAISFSGSFALIFNMPNDYAFDYRMFIKNVADSDRAFVHSIFKSVKQTASIPTFYFSIKLESVIKHLLLKGTIIKDKTGAVESVHGIVQDVTHFREALSLVDKQRNHLDKIAWAHSHTLRAPIASILGLVDILKQDEALSNEHRSIVVGITEAARQLDEVVRDLSKN